MNNLISRSFLISLFPKDKKFFNWLKLNSKYIFSHQKEKLIYAIKKSCKIKLSFVNKDANEKNLRMILNFGHTFAHAIEIKNNYSNEDIIQLISGETLNE